MSGTTLPEAATAARAILAAQLAAQDVVRVRRFLLRELPRRLHLVPAHVAVSIDVANDAIGLAALRRDGRLVAVAGLKADCVADADGWLTARVTEIEAAP